jgi:DNA-binding response OmpR family regulator
VDVAQDAGTREVGGLRIDPASYSAGYNGTPITLTKKEFDLLNYLWQHENHAVTRDELLTNVWGYEFTGDTNIVDVYIRYLRQKIDDRFGIKTIHTIRAVGYMFSHE